MSETAGWLAIAAAYLLGAVPTGYLVFRWMRGEDIRRVGHSTAGDAGRAAQAAGVGRLILTHRCQSSWRWRSIRCGRGWVASLAHPGGNITGLAALLDDVFPKQVQLLKDALPKLTRLAVLSNANNIWSSGGTDTHRRRRQEDGYAGRSGRGQHAQ